MILTPSGHGKTSVDMVGSFWPNLILGDALGPELWPFVCPTLLPNVQILIDKIFLTWSYDHLQTWFWSFIIELVTRNPTMGMPPLEDGLFVNLLIFHYFWSAFVMRLRCVWTAFERVRVAFEVCLKCVWDAFEVRLRWVWGVFAMRERCFAITNQPPH